MDGRPLDILEEALGTEVMVRLKDGEEFLGALAGYDQHMNLVLNPPEDEEVIDRGSVTPVRDTTVIRGDNVVTINT